MSKVKKGVECYTNNINGSGGTMEVILDYQCPKGLWYCVVSKEVGGSASLGSYVVRCERDLRVISGTVEEPVEDMVNSPTHYTSDPSGVECITIVRHRNFNVGNAIKYLWRNGLKKDSDLQDSAKQVEDLEKAVFYIKDEIARLQA